MKALKKKGTKKNTESNSYEREIRRLHKKEKGLKGQSLIKNKKQQLNLMNKQMKSLEGSKSAGSVTKKLAEKKAGDAAKLGRASKSSKPIVKKLIGGIIKNVAKTAAKKRKKTTGGKNKSGNFPTQKKGVIANKFKVTEGSRLDPDTGGSVNIGRKVGTQGEKVTGVNKPGARGNNFLKDQQTDKTRKRAARTVTLEKKKKEGTLTAKERVELSNINKSDREAFRRQTNQTLQAKQRRNDAAKKRGKQPKVDDVAHFTQTGEIREGFNPTPNQIKVAIRNAEARKDTPAVRKLKARQQALEPTKPGKTAIKSYKGNTGKPKVNLNSGKSNKVREHKSRTEERKAGGPIVKRKRPGTTKPDWMKGLSEDRIKEMLGGPKPSGERRTKIKKKPSKVRKAKAGGPIIKKRFGSQIGKIAKKAIGGPGSMPKKSKSKKTNQYPTGKAKPVVKKMGGGKVYNYKKGTGSKTIKGRMSGNDVVAGCYD